MKSLSEDLNYDVVWRLPSGRVWLCTSRDLVVHDASDTSHPVKHLMIPNQAEIVDRMINDNPFRRGLFGIQGCLKMVTSFTIRTETWWYMMPATG